MRIVQVSILVFSLVIVLLLLLAICNRNDSDWTLGEIRCKYKNKSIPIQLSKSVINDINLSYNELQWSDSVDTYTTEEYNIYFLKQNDIVVGVYSATGSLSINKIGYNSKIGTNLLKKIGSTKIIVYNSKNTRMGLQVINNIHIYCYSTKYVLYLAGRGNFKNNEITVNTIGLFEKDILSELYIYKIVTTNNHPIYMYNYSPQ